MRSLIRSAATWLLLCCVSSVGQPPTQWSRDEESVWGLEQAYWRYCKGMDLDKYLTLWHASVVGWPSTYSAPAGKNHISDWLTDRAKNDLTMKSYDLEPLAIKVTDNVAVVHYRVKYSWVNKEGKETPVRSRITHTWIKSPDGWQIIGGMSGPVDAQGR
jgi:ketosteroid isomerase-like protein